MKDLAADSAAILKRVLCGSRDGEEKFRMKSCLTAGVSACLEIEDASREVRSMAIGM